MKTIVLYAVTDGKGCAGPYWPVYPQGVDTPVMVRAEVHRCDLQEALVRAIPQVGETVLNSIQCHEAR